MLRTVAKLAIAALVVNAAARFGAEYLAHLQFRDALRQAIVDEHGSDDAIVDVVLAVADHHGVPLAEEAVQVERDLRQVAVRGSYVKPVVVFPRVIVPWPLEFEVAAYLPVVTPAPLRQ